jgi:hypothetical protein
MKQRERKGEMEGGEGRISATDWIVEMSGVEREEAGGKSRGVEGRHLMRKCIGSGERWKR